jgi:hypothetical protein
MLEQVMNDLEAARYALTIERDFVKIHIERAEGRTEIIELK